MIGPRVLALAAIVLAGAGCKRQQAPAIPEVWDDEPAPEVTDALGTLAPPWPAPTRVLLENGLLGFWLHEPGTVGLHVRLLVPTTSRSEPPGPAATAVVVEHLRHELQRRLGKRDVVVDVAHAPDRFEIAMHGRTDDLRPILDTLGFAVGRGSSIDLARERLRKHVEAPRTDALATAVLAGRLLGLPAPELVSAADVAAVGRKDAQQAWSELLDPRDVVLVVHAGDDAESRRGDLHALAQKWRGTGRRDVEGKAIARLRGRPTARAAGLRLLSAPPAPIVVVSSAARGSMHLVLGRVIPTPTAADRGAARLAQRLAQEQLDTNLVMAGDRALLLVRVPLSRADPDVRARRVVDELHALALTRQPRQRLLQATQLWLGARVVQASVAGEDWTALWSEALDLSARDSDIGLALARDAHAMLELDPDALATWQRKWMDPTAGEPGWQWVVAGADETALGRLARATALDRTAR